MDREYIRNAFKSLEDLQVVIEPVKTPLLREDAGFEPAPVDDSELTVADLFNQAGSYVLTHEFDNEGATNYLFLEGLQDGESCDVLFETFDINNINEVLIEILDEEHDFIDSLRVDFDLSSPVSEVVAAAKSQLGGEEASEEKDASEENEENVRDYVGEEPVEEEPAEPELPPVEVEQEPVEEGLAESKKKLTDEQKNNLRQAHDNHLYDEFELFCEYLGDEEPNEVYAKYEKKFDYDEEETLLNTILELEDKYDVDEEFDESLKESQKFNIQDDEDMKEADELLNKEEEPVEQIIDANAEITDDLRKTYIGSAILQCPTCKAMIYKNPDELVKGEETDTDEVLYNVEEECPRCGAKDGFELIGQVAALDINPDAEPEAPMEEKEEETEVEVEEEPEPAPKAEPMPELPPEEPANEELEEKFDPYEDNIFEIIDDAVPLRAIKAALAKDKTEFEYEGETYYIKTRGSSIIVDDEFSKENGGSYATVNSRGRPVNTDESLDEDTVKQGDHWVNKGEEGTHGKFKTKKEADAQRKAMFANGYHESLEGQEVQLEGFDTNKYDRLVNRYLRETYANVKSYKTTDASIADDANTIILEGTITFKSGVEKPTKFVFEAKELTKKNQLKLVGSNTTLTEGKAFTVLGSIKNKTLLSESFAYKYKVNDTKVKGKIEPAK